MDEAGCAAPLCRRNHRVCACYIASDKAGPIWGVHNPRNMKDGIRPFDQPVEAGRIVKGAGNPHKARLGCLWTSGQRTDLVARRQRLVS